MTTRIVVGAFSPSVLLRVARLRGDLDEAGLGVEEVPVASSPAQFRSLVDRELDVALTSPDNVLAYRFSGRNPLGQRLDAKIISGIDRGMGLALYGRPGSSPDQSLQGAKVAVDVPTSGFALALYALTESLGVARDDYELAALGSTPKRLRALLDGACDATMLNAGNELVAEARGCPVLARVSQVCHPYVGTVLSVVGDANLDAARRLSDVLEIVSEAIRAGAVDDLATGEAHNALDLDEELARRYVDRMKAPDEGLVGGTPDPLDGLRTVVQLRRRYLPEVEGGRDPLEDALAPHSGLVAPAAPVQP